jgi:hypothetical protein
MLIRRHWIKIERVVDTLFREIEVNAQVAPIGRWLVNGIGQPRASVGFSINLGF